MKIKFSDLTKSNVAINAMGMRSTKYGGLEKFMVQLSHELRKVNITLFLIYNSDPQSFVFKEDLLKSGGKIIVLNGRRHPIKYFFKLYKLVRKYNVLLVHTHFQNAYPIIFARIIGIKIIVASLRLMITDPKYEIITNRRQLPLKNRFLKFLINKFLTKIFTVSEACKIQYVSLFPEVKHKIECFYHGSLPNFYELVQRNNIPNLPDNKIIIGTICFNSPIKGLDILFKSMAILKNKYHCNDFIVVNIGIDPKAQENTFLISQCSREGLEKEMIWMGIRNDIPELIQNFDIYCQPSRSEGLPLAVMEAGMAALPIVGTKIGGIPELVIEGYNGFLFELGRTDQLADCLFKLIKDTKLREKMGKNSKELMMKSFNLEVQALKMSQFYTEAINHV